MYSVKNFIFMASLACAWGQDDEFRYNSGRGKSASQSKIPAILMHKQALGTDGAFNYAFAAENGMKQGESIQPDGSRQGAYSYVDPDGQTISVKYTAGKDGFKIVEGNHIPKSTHGNQVALHEEDESNAYDQSQHYPKYKKQRAFKPYYRVYEEGSAEQAPEADVARPTYHKLEKHKQRQQEEESREPHNFGQGYYFEFGSP